MTIEQLRNLCLSFPHATEDVKWGNDLCFSIGGKMFCVTGLEEPLSASFKVRQEEFEEMCQREHIVPAPYVARYHWVLVQQPDALSGQGWEDFVKQSYELVRAALPKKVREGLGQGH